MFAALLTGLFLGFSLIVAIGAQNAFVLRQGILKQHVFSVALFCSISDVLLIILGVAGISYLLNDLIHEYSKIIFGLSAIWLIIYGVFRIRSALRLDIEIVENITNSRSLSKTISIAAIFTFANPHVYLDTIILIGSISQQYHGNDRLYFASGACIASLVWFFSIAYGAKLLAPILQKPKYWRFMDILIATIMFLIAFNLLIHEDLL